MNLFASTSNQTSRYRTKIWTEITDEVRGTSTVKIDLKLQY